MGSVEISRDNHLISVFASRSHLDLRKPLTQNEGRSENSQPRNFLEGWVRRSDAVVSSELGSQIPRSSDTTCVALGKPLPVHELSELAPRASVL